MGKTSISSRELSKKINKSTNYISSILLKKIQTIEFKTALAIVETLNPQINATELLIENFSIEPDEFILKRIQEAEECYEKKLQMIKELDEITENIHHNLVDDLLANGLVDKIKIIEKLSQYDFQDDIFYLLKNLIYLKEEDIDKYNLFLLMADEIYEEKIG